MAENTISQRKLLGIAGLGWMFDALDVGVPSSIIAALQSDWGLTPEQMGWIGSVNSIGMAVGALLFGLWSDSSAGRIIYYDLIIVFCCEWFFSIDNILFAFLILRFFIGTGLGGEFLSLQRLFLKLYSKRTWTSCCFT